MESECFDRNHRDDSHRNCRTELNFYGRYNNIEKLIQQKIFAKYYSLQYPVCFVHKEYFHLKYHWLKKPAIIIIFFFKLKTSTGQWPSRSTVKKYRNMSFATYRTIGEYLWLCFPQRWTLNCKMPKILITSG